MATVYLPSGLTQYTGGLESFVIEAPRVRELMRELVARYPEIGKALDHMAVAIDGEIHNDAEFLPLKADSEVHLVPRIAGGQEGAAR